MADKDKDFNMTKEEVDRFEKAMKNEEFRKLLVEYAEEISDPANKKKYEEEIAQMERERGMDVKFVNPEDGFVVKTTQVNDGIKAFVNICYNENIGNATSHYAEKNEDGERKKGQQWSIPYSLSQPRDDLDRAGKKCITIDAVFNPDTFKKCKENPQFKKMVINTALEGIEGQLQIKLEKKNLKFPKMKFKGMKQATVIRNKSQEESTATKSPNEGITIGDKTIPYPYANGPSSAGKPGQGKGSAMAGNNKEVSNKDNKNNNSGPVEPAYHITHRGFLDFQNFTNARDSCTSTRPKELVVKIDLPTMKSAKGIELDIFEKQLLLNNEKPPYHLDLALPYPVDEKEGSAKFDKSKHQLVVTLTVLQPPPPTLPELDIPLDQANESALVEEIEELPQPKSEVIQENLPQLMSESNKEIEQRPQLNSQEDDEQSINCSEDQCATNPELVNNTSSAQEASQVFGPGDIPVLNSAAAVATSNVTDTKGDVNGINKDQDLQFEVTNDLSEMSCPFFFKCPSYTYHQDEDTITFIVEVTGVAMENVSLGFNENKCYISFPSVGTIPHGLPGPDYALYVTFNTGQNLSPDLCHIDATEQNLVLTLHKEETCKGLWDTFRAGPSEEKLEEKYFLTESCIQSMLEEISSQDPWAKQSKYDSQVEVTALSEESLTLNIESKPKEDFAETTQASSENHVDSKTLHSGNTTVNKGNTDSGMEAGIEREVEQVALKLQESRLSSSDEGIVSDFPKVGAKNADHTSGLISSPTDDGRSEENGESKMYRSDSVDSATSDRSADSDILANGIRTRKSCIRRSSSCSTDDSLCDSLGDGEFDLYGSLSPNGTPGSPGRKNVRFNLNPNVRVFSNKKDKKRWKMEQKLKAQQKELRESTVAENGSINYSKGLSIKEEGVASGATSEGKRKDSESSIDDDWTLVDKPTETALSNNLIFELDD